jgi:hypothetical protein
METIDPDDIVTLINRLIDIHQTWIVNGVSDAEDRANEDAGIRKQEVTITEFAAQHSLPENVRSKLSSAIRQFLNCGATGDGDGPLVEDTPEYVYRAFATRLSAVIATGGDPREVFAPFLNVDETDIKAQVAREIHIAMGRLGADAKLLFIFERWCNSLDDAETLAALQDYNRQDTPSQEDCADGSIRR